MLKWLWLSLAVIITDQVTKYYATDLLIYAEPVAVMPLFNLTLLHNTGAAFSFLSDAGGWQRWFFSAMAVGVSIGITIWLSRLGPRERWLAIALALVVGGALGNLWDRLYFGYVVDFIQVYYQRWYFPAFNIADSAITIGAIMLLIDALFGSSDESRDDSDGRVIQ
jgi:signal peptidase II